MTGRDGPANQNRLCVKGRFGFDYVHNPERLLRPMIRKDGVPKVPHETIDPANPWTHFRPANWEEALERAAAGLKRIRDRDGPKALAGFGSAKASNEEAYLFQKLVRAGFGTNNVDHCTRLCHASSVAALLEGVGSAAVSATFNEVKNSDVIIVIGANPTENHPVAATFFKQAAKRGAKLIVMDPRGQALKRHAWRMMQFKNGTDVAMLNGMLNVIVGEKLYDRNMSRPMSRASRPSPSTSRTSRRRKWRRSAAFPPIRCARSRAPSRARSGPSSSGAWASRSTCTAPTMRAA